MNNNILILDETGSILKGVSDKSIVSISIPNSVTIIGHCAFNDCNSLQSIEIPNSVTEIAEGAFVVCI